jgi:excisionase family DNA binding protein
METNRKWLNIREAAQHLSMSVAFLRKATRTRIVPFARVGTKALRFDREALDAWLEAHSCGGEMIHRKSEDR